jgi:hypothetical protein
VVSFKGVLLEGLEVVFIVLTFGISAGNVGCFNVGRVGIHKEQHAGRIADNVFEPGSKDRKRVAEVEARADRLRDVVQSDDFAVRTAGLPGMVGALGACFGRVVDPAALGL